MGASRLQSDGAGESGIYGKRETAVRLPDFRAVSVRRSSNVGQRQLSVSLRFRRANIIPSILFLFMLRNDQAVNRRVNDNSIRSQ